MHISLDKSAAHDYNDVKKDHIEPHIQQGVAMPMPNGNIGIAVVDRMDLN